jgi:hypothetical protein
VEDLFDWFLPASNKAEQMQKLREWHEVDREAFRNEIVTRNEPAVLKSLVGDWPAVQHATTSPESFASYLSKFDVRKSLPALVGPPAIEGRFFYRDDLKGFNFDRVPRTLMSTLSALSELAEVEQPPAISMQAVPIADNLPGFCDDNQLPLLDESIQPRMWLSNKTMTTTHYDTDENIACAVAGRRRFTLFPPDQIGNLYVGPLLLTPAGAPMSMVDLRQPDFSRHPKFKTALDAALQADLEPGDSLYIPSYWWHNVESLDSFSVLINYWWEGSEGTAVNPSHSLLHSMLSIPELPLEQRKIWRGIFDYYVFQVDQDPAAHLPEDLEDIVGNLPPERQKRLMEFLGEQLKQT